MLPFDTGGSSAVPEPGWVGGQPARGRPIVLHARPGGGPRPQAGLAGQVPRGGAAGPGKNAGFPSKNDL
jgi:hypothetical protein